MTPRELIEAIRRLMHGVWLTPEQAGEIHALVWQNTLRRPVQSLDSEKVQ